MTGVAQAADSIEDLAAFLGGEPEEAHDDEEQAESQPDDGVGDQQDDASDESSENDPQDEDEDNREDEEKPEDQTSERKFKVPTKGEDGQEIIEEVSEQELIAGFLRQKAFTQKTMELSDRERKAAEIVQQKVTEASQYALQQAQMARAAVVQLAGLKSEQELADLAQSDPHAWIQEQQRMKHIGALLQQLEGTITAEQQKLQEAHKQAEREQIAKAWEVLTAKGIDQAKLGDIYGKVMEAYQVTPAQLGKLLEPGLALALKDALAYRELQAKKPQITQKVKEAERLPTQKKTLPANERQNRSLNQKFSSGRAKVNDLAAFIANNKL